MIVSNRDIFEMLVDQEKQETNFIKDITTKKMREEQFEKFNNYINSLSVTEMVYIYLAAFGYENVEANGEFADLIGTHETEDGDIVYSLINIVQVPIVNGIIDNVGLNDEFNQQMRDNTLEFLLDNPDTNFAGVDLIFVVPLPDGNRAVNYQPYYVQCVIAD